MRSRSRGSWTWSSGVSPRTRCSTPTRTSAGRTCATIFSFLAPLFVLAIIIQVYLAGAGVTFQQLGFLVPIVTGATATMLERWGGVVARREALDALAEMTSLTRRS